MGYLEFFKSWFVKNLRDNTVIMNYRITLIE